MDKSKHFSDDKDAEAQLWLGKNLYKIVSARNGESILLQTWIHEHNKQGKITVQMCFRETNKKSNFTSATSNLSWNSVIFFKDSCLRSFFCLVLLTRFREPDGASKNGISSTGLLRAS